MADDNSKLISNYEKYLKVQKEGKYNMFTEATKAAKAAKLKIDEYMDILRNYSKYKKLYESSK